ncbi:DNA-3-methyladenine glycosylase family protein [Chromobacterium sphagni]|uniref:DNA-3-methyladenine glycosylase II n=1 Tax=Chromobacterium sphagni TaxID=1903179 RepID=A0A1S1WVG8_9NEIS|nr:AlkA N-terminal domain-containing protein [Chromobacterium sphagni]OHX11274.1 3-methyladenine DNA glycosylase 2 [Chromobacterium sphagni]OHX19049.1 3-methyladenine DNA glycosylase 2 [Chromobacterium sphagni]
MSVSRCDIPLPENFRPEDILAFHRRDGERLAEQVDDHGLKKGLLWRGLPSCLELRFQPGAARLSLAIDGAAAADDAGRLASLGRRMLGLDQPVEAFERQYGAHPQLGRLIAARPGLRVPQTAFPFEALAWAITGQQISVQAAVSIRRRMLQLCDCRHSSGLLCHPDAARLAGLDADQLGQAGFSHAKSRAILALSRDAAAGALPLDAWLDGVPVEEISERLLAVPGIGPWTVSYALLRGYGWLDGSLHGDVAVRRAMQMTLGLPDKVSQPQAQRWLQDFSPWRALVAAHLWALLQAGGF